MDFEMAKPNFNPLLLVPKSDLKAARLVCKAWRVFANKILFETVYVSANQEDLDVFRGIAGSEELSVRVFLRCCYYELQCIQFWGYGAQGWLQWHDALVVEP